jgi:hypothetical protein
MDAQISDGIVRSSSSATEHGESNESINEAHDDDDILGYGVKQSMMSPTWTSQLVRRQTLIRFWKISTR